MTKRRGAVVIGVNKTGGELTPLDSPRAGADAFANWLKAEGFEVNTITDTAGPVTPQQIADAISKFVEAGNCHQLVLYFSGHGFWKNDSELWLLTSPEDANAAVSWAETAEFAKDCGIPSVVMISDACRSIPNTPRKMKVRGSIVFPNLEGQRTRAKVDKFMAAATGRPAYEVPLGANGQKESVFTHCFLRAFKAPDRDMIREVIEDGKKIVIVPNRCLGKYLQREVTDLLATVDIKLEQAPDAEVLSDEDVYIGRAHLHDAFISSKSPELDTAVTRPPIVDLRDVAAVAIDRAMDQAVTISSVKMGAIEDLARSSGFEDAVSQAKALTDIRHFETETGFGIVGTSVVEALTVSGGQAEILAPGDGRNPGVVRIAPQDSACSVVFSFSNGRGTPARAVAVKTGPLGPPQAWS